MVFPGRPAIKCLIENKGLHSAVNGPKAGQCGFSKVVNVLICAFIEVLHHILLKEEWVVGTHRASAVKVLLVVVAHIGLALGWEELINIHLVTQRQHDDDT
jgi:hypothetical protein